MNKRDALALLANNLEEYLQQGFRFHPAFMQEFKELLHGASGMVQAVMKKKFLCC